MNRLQSGCFGRRIKRVVRALPLTFIFGILLLVCLAVPCGAQDAHQSRPLSAAQIAHQRTRMVLPEVTQDTPSEGYRELISNMQRRQLIAARQKSIASHTKKLLKLAAELNAELANAHAEAPTKAQLRKIAEIQKLAHSIRKDISIPAYMPVRAPVPFVPPPFPARHR